MPNESEQRISLIRNERSQSSGESLRKWRRWYAEGDGQQGDKLDPNNPADLDAAKKIIASFQKRIDEREATIAELRQSSGTLSDQVKAIQDAQRKQLEEQGNYSELAKQRAAEVELLKPKAQIADDAAAFLKDLNDQTTAGIPELYRKLVPDFGDSYEAQKRKAAWLRENMTLLTKPAPPNFDGGAGAGGGSGGRGSEIKVTDDDKRQAEIAASQGYNVKPEDIAKRREAMKADKPGANE